MGSLASAKIDPVVADLESRHLLQYHNIWCLSLLYWKVRGHL